VVGTYGKAMSHNLLFGDKGNPEFSVAAIVGQRVLTFSEPPMKAEVNLPMLKSLSGGDSLSGRLPYGKEEISFVPECSLWLSTNHALEIPDEAVWRRLKFFPFEYSMSEREVIPDLRSAITRQPAELRLALAWMIEGAKAWNEHGWGDTSAWAETATDERAKHNIFAKWSGACLEVTGSVGDTFSHADMVVSFNTWVMFAGEDSPKLSKAAVRDELENVCRGLRMTYDKKRKLMVGGRLV
jgi:putative DNA primase/helicase